MESSDPLWRPDPDLEQMTVDYRRAFARLVPLFMPDILFRLGPDNQPLFREFAAAIVPTEFLPGKLFGTAASLRSTIVSRWRKDGSMPPVESRSCDHPAARTSKYISISHFAILASTGRRLEGERAITETLVNWSSLNARSKFWGDDQRAAFKNWEEIGDPRNPLDGRQGVNERIMLRELLRRADMMVISGE